MDLKNFDPQFTNEKIPDSFMEDGFQIDVEIDDAFSGFSYSAEDAFTELQKKMDKL